jgi:hypothetical protein
MARKRGRPKVPRSLYKGKTVQIRVTVAEYKLLTGMAGLEGLTLAEWARRRILGGGEPTGNRSSSASHA